MTAKAQRTKAHLQQTALRLFTERGFNQVTVEDIASEAGVSHMTFYRHFPTKESVVLDDPFDPMIGTSVAAQDPALRPIERVRLGLLGILAHLDPSDDHEVYQRVRLAVAHPALRSRIWENNHRTEQVIVDSLVQSGTPPATSAVAAGAVLGAVTAALIHWAESGAKETLQDCLGSALAHLANDSETAPA